MTLNNPEEYYRYMRDAESHYIDTEMKKPEDYFVKDEITKAVIMDLVSRAKRGYKKYNTTLGENNKDDYMNHLYEELLDAAQYIKKEMSIIPEIQNLIKQYPNDADLGEQIRLIYGQK
jgi:hypothetical protein